MTPMPILNLSELVDELYPIVSDHLFNTGDEDSLLVPIHEKLVIDYPCLDKFVQNLIFKYRKSYPSASLKETSASQQLDRMSYVLMLIQLIGSIYYNLESLDSIESLLKAMEHCRLNFDLEKLYLELKDEVDELYQSIFHKKLPVLSLPPIIV